MNSKLFWRFSIKDPGGEVVAKTPLIRARSFVVAYLEHIQCAMARANLAGVVDEGNTSRTLRTPSAAVTQFMTLTGALTRGIMVGSGATAVDIEDFDLDTEIADGGAAGELNYAALVLSAVDIGANFAQIGIFRDFSNTSGGVVTVREAGLKCFTTDSGGTDRTFLLARDLVSPIQAVPNGGTLVTEAIFRATV